MAGYTLGGVWRVLGRAGLGLRTARVQQFSPDPEYRRKLARLGRCLREAAADPGGVAAVFLDEMGYARWPDEAYPGARRIYVVPDNWSIHAHPDVRAALGRWPRITPVWLPTYAPWLNPIEKLWRWLRRDVLQMHRLAGDWAALRGRVNGFLDQFAGGSRALLRYVGLLGDGRLARWLRPR
jgi:hypothetical protein